MEEGKGLGLGLGLDPRTEMDLDQKHKAVLYFVERSRNRSFCVYG